jgi:hypothetical protein
MLNNLPQGHGEQWVPFRVQVAQAADNLPYQIPQPNPITQPIDSDTNSLVAESYLSDHHIHQQQKNHGTQLSDFQVDFLKFCDAIAKFGSIKELSWVAKGRWMFSLVAAQSAIDDAGSHNYNEYYQFLNDYKALTRHPQNDIKQIADSKLRHLAWIGLDDPAASESASAMDGSIFLSRIARQVLFVISISD